MTDFDTATAHLDTPLPDLTHAIVCTSAAQATAKIRAATAGQTILVKRGVWIPGEFTGFNRNIVGTVRVVFEPGSGFIGFNNYFPVNERKPAVYLNGVGGWRIWGGEIVNPKGGGGILLASTRGPFTWTGFIVQDTADQCVAVYPINGDIHATLKGVAGSDMPYLAYDPHLEKGTGIHAWNIADATHGIVSGEYACDVLDQATGAAVELRTDKTADLTLYVRAHTVGLPLVGTSWKGYAQHQTAGNALQLWGGALAGPLDVKYLEGNTLQGRMLQTAAVTGDLSECRIEYGRAAGPIELSPLVGPPAYMVRHGVVLGDCEPLP